MYNIFRNLEWHQDEVLFNRLSPLIILFFPEKWLDEMNFADVELVSLLRLQVTRAIKEERFVLPTIKSRVSKVWIVLIDKLI